MNSVPELLRSRGVVMLAEPSALKAEGFELGSAQVGVTPAGQLLLGAPGGLFSSGKVLVLEPGVLRLSGTGGQIELSGGALQHLALELDEQSLFLRVLREAVAGRRPVLGLGEGRKFAGLADASWLYLDTFDPRRPPRAVALGRARSTPALWVHADGSLCVDDPHQVVRGEARAVRAVELPAGEPTSAVVHLLRAQPPEWLLGLRLRAIGAAPLPGRGAAPLAVAAARVRGTLEGQPVSGGLCVRTTGALELLNPAGQQVGQMELAEMRWRADGDLLLVKGQGESLAITLPEAEARWLMRGVAESPAPLFEVVEGPVPPGAGEARVEGTHLVLATSGQAAVELASLDTGALQLSDGPLGPELRVGPQLVLRGAARAVAGLRESVSGALGQAQYRQADLADLYRRYHALRTERWLWNLYGHIFLTGAQLEAAGNLPREGDEDDDHLRRRRVVAETLVVAEQVRALRLRLGAAAVALPYALLDEESRFLEAFAGEQAGPVLARGRARLADGLRLQIRQASLHLTFALVDIERAVARLEPVHAPELRGGQGGLLGTSTLGRLGVGAAVMLLNPISGTVQIMSTVAGSLTDGLSKDSTSRALIDRFGPMCRSSWELLVDVSAVAALETRAWLLTTWAELARRDRELHDSLPPAQQARLREALLARLAELQRQRQQPVPLTGKSVADVAGRMEQKLAEGPFPLLSTLLDPPGQ